MNGIVNEMKGSKDQQTQTIHPSLQAKNLQDGFGSIAFSCCHFSVARRLIFKGTHLMANPN